jgi:uncharacterized protein YyaL (SSP411 family)
MTMPTNRLAGATSPYLLQHATNPVDWFPWGDEAFSVARQRDVPVFLSVGYAACHWCHVMERESFENDATATFLNEHFVAVKVDREERPDIDSIYMTAVQAMTGQGGWPMSLFLTSEGDPFWAATYLPDTPRHGMPSFRQVLEGVAEAWNDRREEVVTQGVSVTHAIERATSSNPPPGPAPSAADAMRRLRETFDERWGGFGGAPKFPQTPVLEWLLRRSVRGDDAAEDMLRRTLEGMANGGIHDQIAGGFARYSTDAAWHVPHFEKMLYDNAQLLTLYTRAWLHLRQDRFRGVALQTARMLLTDFALPGGGFSSSIDADTADGEGGVATWRWSELVDLVGPAVADAFGALPEGNWEGTNVLWHPHSLADVAARHGRSVQTLMEDLAGARVTLAAVRAARPQPAVDDKAVAAWNGLAILGLATASRTFNEPSFLEAAAACAEFVWEEMRVSGRLQRAWRDSRTSGPAFLDDHALLGLGLLGLFETTGAVRWFDRSRELADSIQRLFITADGPVEIGRDAEQLIVRPRDRSDDVTASGPSAAAELFLRLSHLTGDAELEERAAVIVANAGGLPAQAPTAFGHLWSVMDLLEGPVREVAIVGDQRTRAARALLEEVVAVRYLPNVVVAPSDPADPDAERVPLLEGRIAENGWPTAFVCERFACKLPVTSPEALAAQLGGRGPGRLS